MSIFDMSEEVAMREGHVTEYSPHYLDQVRAVEEVLSGSGVRILSRVLMDRLSEESLENPEEVAVELASAIRKSFTKLLVK